MPGFRFDHGICTDCSRTIGQSLQDLVGSAVPDLADLDIANTEMQIGFFMITPMRCGADACITVVVPPNLLLMALGVQVVALDRDD